MAFSQNFFISFLIYQLFHPLPYKRTFFCRLAQFSRNFSQKTYLTPYKHTFSPHLVRFVTNFLLKISPHHIKVHFLPIWFKFLIFFTKISFYPPYYIVRHFFAVWLTLFKYFFFTIQLELFSHFGPLSAKNISTPNIDTFFAFGPLI